MDPGEAAGGTEASADPGREQGQDAWGGFDLEGLSAEIQAAVARARATVGGKIPAIQAATSDTLERMRAPFSKAQSSRHPLKARIQWLREVGGELGDAVLKTGMAACRPGCSHCCHIPVSLTRTEAEIIGAAVGRKVNKVRRSRSHDPEKFGYSEPCPFLGTWKDGKVTAGASMAPGQEQYCGIYEHRPLVCRTHLNMDDTEVLCRLVTGRSVPVPLMDATDIQVAYMQTAVEGGEVVVGDIRDFFGASEGSG